MHDSTTTATATAAGARSSRRSARFRGFPGMGGFPDWQGLEGNFRIGRMLASGDLRLVALYLIEQQPRHGYDLIKAIEEKTGGFYSPSPGVVYPALTFLEEAGYVTSSADGNKKALHHHRRGPRPPRRQPRRRSKSTLDYLGEISRRWSEFRDKFARNRRARSRPPVSAVRRRRRSRPRHPQCRPRGQRRAPGPQGGDRGSAVRGAQVDQRKLAEILRRAAEEIRGLGRDPRRHTAIDL